jgi:hypothetical protein
MDNKPDEAQTHLGQALIPGPEKELCLGDNLKEFTAEDESDRRVGWRRKRSFASSG